MTLTPKNNLINNMTSKSRLRNIKYLNNLGRNARGDAVEKVSEVIKLYSETKVSQISTAENMFIDLIYNKKNQRQQKATTKKYEKIYYKTSSQLTIKQTNYTKERD